MIPTSHIACGAETIIGPRENLLLTAKPGVGLRVRRVVYRVEIVSCGKKPLASWAFPATEIQITNDPNEHGFDLPIYGHN